ncbi:putative stearoyl-CoA desaturase 5 isoform X4 [Apostichopus japonicus]|uniref:Putative stearoyl-CoA desaturase 5 isoform X4 n=1 Tax=Stichopus japonicus TaxID=307972 RepID=A0A2G8KES7_STIJA|nr:putative stearoyl-CoA desaturase 5 isoform X4 [Apostichopus japonicus]
MKKGFSDLRTGGGMILPPLHIFHWGAGAPSPPGSYALGLKGVGTGGLGASPPSEKYGGAEVSFRPPPRFATFVLGWFSNLGITAGAHRLWSHKSYSAKLPLRIFLAIIACLSCQNSIYIWCRDHRVHHKFTETDGDPHNAKRGFFFSHMGWLWVKKHPDVIKNGAKLDFSDLMNDPVVFYQHKFYYPLILMISFVLPTVVPYFLWNESLWNAYFVAAVMRLVLTLNITWCVNSAAHMWGYHPYDESIEPAENIAVSFFALGEGWHNYHHVFPFDYRAAELPWKVNPTTQFIDLMHLIGQAYGLKYMSKEAIRSRATKYGDGSIYPRGDKTN